MNQAIVLVALLCTAFGVNAFFEELIKRFAKELVRRIIPRSKWAKSTGGKTSVTLEVDTPEGAKRVRLDSANLNEEHIQKVVDILKEASDGTH